VNDGPALDDTMFGILDRFPKLATVGVVPLGVSAHSNEPDMRPHTRAEAEGVVDIVERWQVRFDATLGRRLAYCSDEYYLLAGRPFPALDAYDGCPQHENGIGMARTFEAEAQAALAGEDVATTGTRSGFFAWVEGAPADGYRSPKTEQQLAEIGAQSAQNPANTIVITGEFGAPIIEPLVAQLPNPPQVLTVKNAFFGGNIGVTGLLTGTDIADALAAIPEDARVLLPDVMLSRGRFLDGMSVAQLPRTVEIVATDGAALVKALAS
jgi:NifB/MoaA-like Fe-S oxidoreductase